MKFMFFFCFLLALLSFSFSQKKDKNVPKNANAFATTDSIPLPKTNSAFVEKETYQGHNDNSPKLLRFDDRGLPIMPKLPMDNTFRLGNAEPALPPSMVDFESFLELSHEVYDYRKTRLVEYPRFLKMAAESNTVILDTRSDSMYEMEHLKGAIHLNFSDFNIGSLAALIPSHNTRILIYCNNNFGGENPNFRSKMALPPRPDAKPISLALNIPTFINLYGYGYKNVYELSSLLNSYDANVGLEGKSLRLKGISISE